MPFQGSGFFPCFVCAGLGFLAGADLGLADFRLTGEDVEGRGRGLRGGEACGFEDGVELAGAYNGVDFGDAFADFVAIALDEAAGDDEFFGLAGTILVKRYSELLNGW